MQLVNKIDFKSLRAGSEKFPSLFDFQTATAKQIAEAQEAVGSAAAAKLKRGDGPPAYEEAHRVFSGWRYQLDEVFSGQGAFVRLRSVKDVQSMRAWTMALLKSRVSPVDYLLQFTTQLEHMRNVAVYQRPVYVLAQSTTSSILAAIGAEKMKAESSHSPSSYTHNASVDPRVRKLCSETPGFPIDEWSDKDLLSMVEYAKSIKQGDMIFVDHEYIRIAAEKLAKVL